MQGQFESPLLRDFPSTANLSRQDLEELLGDDNEQGGSEKNDAYFEAFVDSLPEVRAMLDEHIQMLRSNEEKAQRNLSMQPALEALRSETQQLYDRAIAAEAEWPKQEAELKEAYKRFAPPALHAQVVRDAAKLHEQSEALAAAYVDGMPLETAMPESSPSDHNANQRSFSSQQDVDATFTRKYKEMRIEYHRLNLIADRWSKGAVQWE
ncbi:unnamed protein product [Jaminaea pallidilutea]